MSEGFEDKQEQEKPKEVGISLREFRSSGYKRTTWEVAQGLLPQMLFEPMSVEIIGRDDSLADSFFSPLVATTIEQRSLYSTPSANKSVAQTEVVSNEEIEARVAKSFEDGKKEGFEAGKQAALAEVEARLTADQSKRDQLLAEIKNQLAGFYAELEKKALQFALEVSRELLQVTAEAKPEYILDVIRQGLKATGSATPLVIKISPTDYDFLQIVGLPSDLTPQELGVVFQAEESIASGCVIETNYGDIDLQLESMWEQLRENLREVFE